MTVSSAALCQDKLYARSAAAIAATSVTPVQAPDVSVAPIPAIESAPSSVAGQFAHPSASMELMAVPPGFNINGQPDMRITPAVQEPDELEDRSKLLQSFSRRASAPDVPIKPVGKAAAKASGKAAAKAKTKAAAKAGAAGAAAASKKATAPAPAPVSAAPTPHAPVAGPGNINKRPCPVPEVEAPHEESYHCFHGASASAC